MRGVGSLSCYDWVFRGAAFLISFDLFLDILTSVFFLRSRVSLWVDSSSGLFLRTGMWSMV